MRATTLRTGLVLATSILTMAMVLSGCGGGRKRGPSGATVALVGGAPVTIASLNHWTATFIRGDYYSITQHQAPTGLSANPPDYGACADATTKIPPLRSRDQIHLTKQQREAMCRELYRVTQVEALGFLLSTLWTVGQAAERGYHATSREVQAGIAHLYTRYEHEPGGYETFLTKKGWSHTDLRYIMLRDVANNAVFEKLQRQANHEGNPERTLAHLLALNVIRWRAKTTCQPHYLSFQCKQYTPAAAKASLSPAIIIERLAQAN